VQVLTSEVSPNMQKPFPCFGIQCSHHLDSEWGGIMKQTDIWVWQWECRWDVEQDTIQWQWPLLYRPHDLHNGQFMFPSHSP